jgi:hypothetical protein
MLANTPRAMGIGGCFIRPGIEARKPRLRAGGRREKAIAHLGLAVVGYADQRADASFADDRRRDRLHGLKQGWRGFFDKAHAACQKIQCSNLGRDHTSFGL